MNDEPCYDPCNWETGDPQAQADAHTDQPSHDQFFFEGNADWNIYVSEPTVGLNPDNMGLGVDTSTFVPYQHDGTSGDASICIKPSAGDTYSTGGTGPFADSGNPHIVPTVTIIPSGASTHNEAAQPLIPFTTRAYTFYPPAGSKFTLSGPSYPGMRVDIHVPVMDLGETKSGPPRMFGGPEYSQPQFHVYSSGADAGAVTASDANIFLHQGPDDGAGSAQGVPQIGDWLQFTDI